jgi:voltage-gated potassium channel
MNNRPAVPQPLRIAAVLLILVIFAGTAGYVVLEGWSWFDAFYMTVTTITTVGDGEPAPLDRAGKVWTIAVVAVGFAVLTYTVLALMAYVIEGQLGRVFEGQRMRRRIRRMNDHLILCGFGRVGRAIAHEFAEEGVDFVVVDSDEESLEQAVRDGVTVVRGNAADLETLKAAGVERARGLVTAVDNDADNLYVTLSARIIKPDLFIVARANQADAEPKLRLAGANRVVSPYVIGGRRLATLAMRPTAVEFIDIILSASNGELMLEDMTIRDDSPWVGQTLVKLVPEKDAALVLAIKRAGVMLFRPATATVLQGQDELVVAGPQEAVRELESRALGRP